MYHRKQLLAFVLFSIVGLFHFGCVDRPGDSWVTINNLYKMEIPKSLYNTDGLNDEASLQYQNAFKDYYVVVLDESHEELLEALPYLEDTLSSVYGFEEFVTVVANPFLDQLNLTGEINEERQSINGLPAMIKTFNATYDENSIYYRCTYVKGKNHYYQIIAWCLSSDQKEHDPLFIKMLNSFQEVDG